MSMVYFLKCLGFNDIYEKYDKQLQTKHELVNTAAYGYSHCFWDDFTSEVVQLTGLKMNDSSNDNNNISGVNGMSLLLKCMESLISLKMPLSHDLLVLCCIYANYCNNHEFFEVLQSHILECLNGSDENYKTRSYQWFKHFILNSNVWLVKMPNKNVWCKDEVEHKTADETANDTQDNTTLFDSVVVDVNKLLMKQKKYIWNSIKQIQNEKEMNVVFEKLCNFGVNNKNNKNQQQELRQDGIDNGIAANLNEFELLLQKVEMGYGAHSSFDLKFESNTKTYLTQCLAFAHANNNILQSEMKEYFGNELGIKCKYASAPVKLSDRCVVKATSDYGKREYPSCANILDFMRFSVTFDNVNDLLNGLNKFSSDIDKGGVIQCLLPKGVLRIKNGFNDIIHKWKIMEDASYVDIKLNIIYFSPNTNESMIIEAQFLLSFLLKAKKMGHKYYRCVHVMFFISKEIHVEKTV